MKKKIGIVTWYCSSNYGSQLQAYALFKFLNRHGYNACFLTESNHPFMRMIWEFIKSIRDLSFPRLSNKKIFFTKKYLKEYYLNVNTPSFAKFNNVICGSDQIWAPNVFSSYYMLGFVPDDVNKISYAASIGLDYIPDNLKEKYKYFIGRINHVSVREDKGYQLLKDECGIESTVVLDPTLLVDKIEWDKIKQVSTIKSKYIFCYFLKKNHNYSCLVKEYAEKNGFKIFGVSDNEADASWMNIFSHKQVGPCEFIGLIEGAQAVITDSYHGTIFSMLYHKDFILFERFSADDVICQNSRIEQLKKYFNGIDKNIVNSYSINSLEINQVDYLMFEKSLSVLREKSKNFLEKALV